MHVKVPMKVKGHTEVNFKQGEGQFCSARELIPCSPTFKMMLPMLNVEH